MGRLFKYETLITLAVLSLCAPVYIGTILGLTGIAVRLVAGTGLALAATFGLLGAVAYLHTQVLARR